MTIEYVLMGAAMFLSACGACGSIVSETKNEWMSTATVWGAAALCLWIVVSGMVS